jgi:dihydroorotase-like cyclic amidohydrolase
LFPTIKFYHKRKLPLERIAELTSYNPAKIFNVSEKKGNIGVGLDADLTVVNLNREEIITSQKLQSNAGFTLYEGWNVKGWVEQTFLRGECVMNEGKLHANRPNGKYLYRNEKSVVRSY